MDNKTRNFIHSYASTELGDHDQSIDLILKSLVNKRKGLFSLIKEFTDKKNCFSKELIENFNTLSTDYITWSSFVLVPLFELSQSKKLHLLLDNAVSYSYLTNLLQKNACTKEILSIMLDQLTDRFVLEDEMIASINKQHADSTNVNPTLF